MKSVKLSALLICCSAIFATSSVYALQADPSSMESYKNNQAIEVKIIAANDQPAKGYQLRLSIEGGAITKYQVSNPNFLFIGTCNDDGAIYTTTEVCVDIVSKSDIGSGDELGIVNIIINNNTASLKATENNIYILKSTGESIKSTGTIGIYSTKKIDSETLASITSTDIPVTIEPTAVVNPTDEVAGSNVPTITTAAANGVSTDQSMPSYFVVGSLLVVLITTTLIVILVRKYKST